jgi:hypothetical protein
MDIQTVLQECQANRLPELLGIQTQAGQKQFQKEIQLFSSDRASLERRQKAIQQFQSRCTEETKTVLDTWFLELQKLEPELQIFLEHSDVEANSYNQLSFSAWSWALLLNTVPFLVFCVSMFKLYIVPALAVLTPFFMILAPYMLLKHWYNLPLDPNQYLDLLLGMLGLQKETLSTPKGMVQMGVTAVSIGQSIIQPIQNALHLQTIQTNLVKKGYAVEKVAVLLQKLQTILPFQNPLEDLLPNLGDPHRSFTVLWDHPFRLRLALQTIGDVEVLYRIATCSNLYPVEFTKTKSLLLQTASDPFMKKAVPFNLRFSSKRHHAILTGPNRGGKSSVLRTTLLCVVLAQTFGFAPAKTMRLKPFTWIASGLKIDDRPGQSSLFEREVSFAAAILKRSRTSPMDTGLILFDELFHSTNPPDGARTATVFLEKVWKTTNTVSFISTHVFELAKQCPSTVLQLCVPATVSETGLQFSYTVKPGVCSVSSVDEILKEKGLLSAENCVPENPTGKER